MLLGGSLGSTKGKRTDTGVNAVKRSLRFGAGLPLGNRRCSFHKNTLDERFDKSALPKLSKAAHRNCDQGGLFYLSLISIFRSDSLT